MDDIDRKFYVLFFPVCILYSLQSKAMYVGSVPATTTAQLSAPIVCNFNIRRNFFIMRSLFDLNSYVFLIVSSYFFICMFYCVFSFYTIAILAALNSVACSLRLIVTSFFNK